MIQTSEAKETTKLISSSLTTRSNNHNRKFLLISTIAALNGGLYFFVATAGGGNIKKLFNLEDNNAIDAIYGVGAGASICYGMFVYKTLEFLTLVPKSGLAWALTILAPFAASSFLTAGIEGSDLLGLSKIGAPVGLTLFLLRTMSMIDGSVKFPNRLREVTEAWSTAFNEEDYRELARLAITCYTAAGFSLSTTDAIYAASNKLLNWFGMSSDNAALPMLCYVSSALGAIGCLPMSFYWTHRGMRQLTYGGKADDQAAIKDPTDRATAIAAVGTIPVTLGILGSATSAGGNVFGQLGIFATSVRISSSLLYSVAGGVPGLSHLVRSISSFQGSFFSCFSKCRKRDQIEEIEEADHRGSYYQSINKSRDDV